MAIMNTGRMIGVILSVIGFGVAIIAGLWLAGQAAQGTDPLAVLLGAGLAFIPIGLVVGFGIFMYVRGGREAQQESVMRQQRQMLDIVKSRGQIDLHDLALEMSLSVDNVKAMIYDLVGLQVFSGYINWEKGTLYSAEASQLRDLANCRNCNAQIELVGKGVVACPYCGTEYFLT